MPKIRIKELDTTDNPLAINDKDTYILMVKNTAAVADPEGEGQEEAASTEPIEISLKTSDISEYQKHILGLGGHIIEAASWNDAVDYCSDRNQYKIDFILCDSVSLDKAIEIAEARKDCAVVLEVKSNDLEEGKFNATISDKLKADASYITGNNKEADEYYKDEKKEKVGKYVLAFYSKQNLKADNKSDKEEISAAQAYILAYLYSIHNGNAKWLAVAGSKRGEVPYYHLDGGYIKEADIDAMQSRASDGSIAINPICNMNPWGTRIWGNRTALPNTTGETDGLTASSFANIRIIINLLKKKLYDASREFQFEQNNDVLWVNFTSRVNVLLDEMKASYGIAAYKWVRQETSERAKLKANLVIIPTYAVEDFDLSITLTDNLEVAENA